MATSSTSRFYSEGKGFSLPHTDIEALAVECALRSADVDFVPARPSGSYSGGSNLPAVHVVSKTGRTPAAGPKEEDVASRGIADVLALLTRNGKDLDGSLTNDQRIYTKAAKLSFLHQVLPAYNFITTALDEHYAVRQANSTDANSIVAYGLAQLGWDRRNTLADISKQYRITTLAGALGHAAAGLKGLEDMLRVMGKDSAKGFAFGTAKPTSFDCVAFAACSGLLYAEFNGKYGEIRSWQAEQRNEVPRLIALTEAVRLEVFGNTNNHFFTLKPIMPSADSSAYDGEKPFREGRLRFLAITAAFASLYFLVTNASTLVQVLEAMEDGEDEMGEEEDEE